MSSYTKIEFYLTDVIYSGYNNSFKIILIGRKIKDYSRVHLIVNNFHPYFYIDVTTHSISQIFDLIRNNNMISNWLLHEDLNDVTKSYYFRFSNRSVVKLIGKEPFKVPEIKGFFTRNGFNCFEFDIPFTHRFLIDTGLFCGNKYSINSEIVNNHRFKEQFLEINPFELQKTMEKTTETPFLIAAIDIETGNDDNISFQELESKKEYLIIAIGICYGFYSDNSELDFTTKSFILGKDQDEKRLLIEFLEFLKRLDPDCIATFNGDNFDLPYIEYRLSLYELEFKIGWEGQKLQKSRIDGRYRIPGISVVDLFPKTWNIHTKTGKKRLLDIAEYFYPEEDRVLKLAIPELPGSLFKHNKLELLRQYVEQDVIITFQVFHKLYSGDIAIAKINGAPYSDVLLATQRVNGEFLLMRILFEKNILIPHKPRKEEVTIHKRQRKEHPHTGGQVITPKVTTAENVIIADFVSMYPTLISAYNIGSETFISNMKFNSYPRSSLALLQDRVISQRIKIKNTLKTYMKLSSNEKNALQNQQKALKLVANSMYGATLYVQGRFFDIEVCNSITAMARTLMNELFLVAKKFGEDNSLNVEVIYSDTDSVFIRVLDLNDTSQNDKELLSWLKITQDKLLIHLNDHVPRGMDLSLEDIAKRIIFQKIKDNKEEVRKKAYAYYSLLNNKLMIKGFEAIRADLATITKKTQEHLFYILLNEKNPEQKAVKYLKHVITKIQQEASNNSIENFLYSGIIRRAPSKYKSITPAVGAFLDYCLLNDLDPEIYYAEFPRFPYAITTGRRNDPLFKKAKHPTVIEQMKLQIDKQFYVQEILRIAERFELPNPLNKQKSLFDYI